MRKRDRDSDSSYPRDNKEKRAKVYHSLPMSYGVLLPVLIQNYGIFVIPARPRRPPYPKGYDVNAICEYHRGVGEHFVENCTAFKDKVQSLIYADPIKFRELVRSIKIKDQLGTAFVCLLIMNVFIREYVFEKCKPCFNVSMCMK